MSGRVASVPPNGQSPRRAPGSGSGKPPSRGRPSAQRPRSGGSSSSSSSGGRSGGGARAGSGPRTGSRQGGGGQSVPRPSRSGAAPTSRRSSSESGSSRGTKRPSDASARGTGRSARGPDGGERGSDRTRSGTQGSRASTSARGGGPGGRSRSQDGRRSVGSGRRRPESEGVRNPYERRPRQQRPSRSAAELPRKQVDEEVRSGDEWRKRPRGLPAFVDHESETVVASEPVRGEARRAVARGRGSTAVPRRTGAPSGRPAERGRKRPRPGTHRDRHAAALVDRLSAAVGPRRAERLASRLAEAADDFANDRLDDAARILSGIAREAPNVAEVRELLGLVRYRQGRWRPAIKELEAFRQLTGSVEQNAVLADCRRAVGQHGEVNTLWEELRDVSPDAALVTEGRIVAAGDLADQERLDEAIALLARGWRWPKRVMPHHLRRAYALADLYERAGDPLAARALFERVAELDPDLGDAGARAVALR